MKLQVLYVCPLLYSILATLCFKDCVGPAPGNPSLFDIRSTFFGLGLMYGKTADVHVLFSLISFWRIRTSSSNVSFPFLFNYSYPFLIQSPIEQVQSQTEQLSREVKNLQIELMEKNNRMEQLLMLMAKKQGIQWDPEEAEWQEEQEAHSRHSPILWNWHI